MGETKKSELSGKTKAELYNKSANAKSRDALHMKKRLKKLKRFRKKTEKLKKQFGKYTTKLSRQAITPTPTQRPTPQPTAGPPRQPIKKLPPALKPAPVALKPLPVLGGKAPPPKFTRDDARLEALEKKE